MVLDQSQERFMFVSLHWTPEATGFAQKSHKEYLASFEFIQSGDVGMMDPEKVFMSRGKEWF